MTALKRFGGLLATVRKTSSSLTRARPEYVSIEACTKAKREVVRLCIELEATFIADVVLDAIGTGKTAQVGQAGERPGEGDG
jgi:hypothetical protein